MIDLWRNKTSNLKLIFLFIVLSCSNNEKELIDDSEVELFSTVEIYLLNPLDESRGYCIDIKGYKSNAKTDQGLQAHTCYSYQGAIAVDQGFDQKKATEKEFFMPGFNVCMAAKNKNNPDDLKLEACSSNELQRFILTNNGNIILEENPDLCVTVSKGNSREGGGGDPVHLIRDLKIENCHDDLSIYQSWGMRFVSE